MKIGVLTTGVGVVSTFNINYVPEYLYFVAATQLTGLKVTALGDGVICDLDAVGLSAIGVLRRQGATANSYLIPLANGLIKNKNCEIVVTNSAAQTPTLYGVGTEWGDTYIQSIRQVAFANSGAQFEKFAFLAIPAIGATDTLNINYRSGFTTKMEDVELDAMMSMTQNGIVKGIDNFAGEIKSVQLTPAADRSVYMLRYSGASLKQAV
jgi:hypothetical protein